MTATAAVEIDIESLGARGEGIGRLPDGGLIFIAGALPGERVLAEPAGRHDGGVAGRLESIVAPSPDRIAPVCRHFGTCGGCALQHSGPDTYSRFKMERVTQALARHSLAPATVDGPFISAPGTRRRATFAAYHGKGGRMVVGFNERRSNTIVDQAECPVLLPRLAALVSPLRECLRGILLEEQGMDISVAESGGAVDMVMRPWTKKRFDDVPRHIAGRLAVFAEENGIARLHWQLSAADESDLMPVALRAPFTVDLSGAAVTPPPGGFLQATADGERVLVSSVLAGLPRKVKTIADLYAGCGTFTFAMAAAKRKIHAVEGFAPALAALKAAMPGKPVTAEKRDLAREPLLRKELNAYDAVVLDPPRAGALEQVKMIARSDVNTAIYVSCNPASFARDGVVLAQGGYRLQKLTVVDQFLWSPHIELAGVFRRD